MITQQLIKLRKSKNFSLESEIKKVKLGTVLKDIIENNKVKPEKSPKPVQHFMPVNFGPRL